MTEAVDPAGKRSSGHFHVWLPLLVFLAAALLSVYVWQRAQSPSVDGHRAYADGWLLACGVAVGALLALAIHLRRLARDRARQAARALALLGEAREQSERAQVALGVAQRELGDLFGSISDAFYTLDREWRFTLLNARACQLMRLRREQLVGRTLWEVFPETVGAIVEQQFRRAVDHSCTVEFELHFPPLETWFFVRAYPHANGLAVISQDIGERMRAAQHLARVRATSERAQRLAQLGSWEYELRTGELTWSEEVVRTFGIRPDPLARGIGVLLNRVHPDDRVALAEAHGRLLAGEADMDIEYRVQRPDGQLRVVRDVATLVRDEGGAPAFATGAVQDVTQRRRDEDALREAGRRLEQSLVMNRLVMEHSLDVICVLDVNGRFAKVSGAGGRIWGYPAAELAGRDHLDLVHPEDRDASRAMAAAVMAGEATTDFRNRVLNSDGSVVLMQWSMMWSGHDRLYFAVARDVTESGRQSRLLLEAKESLLRAQKVARMGAWELDVSGNHLTWSDEVYGIFGVAREDFAGTFQAFVGLVHPDDLGGLLEAQARALAGEGELDIEHRILLPGGAVGYVHERAKLLHDDRGQPLLLAGSVQDVTDRKRQELRLLESGRRMRATVDCALDCIVAMDTEGRIVEFNPAAEQTFGYRRDQALGQPLAELLVPSSHRAAHTAGWLRHLETGELKLLGRRVEVPALRADGSQIMVELSITPISDEGRQTMVAFMRDITQVRRARALEDGQREILAGIAARQPLAASLEALARLYERQYPGALSSVMMLDETGKRALAAAAPSLPQSYVDAIHGQPVGPKAGACGTAAFRGERVVSSDIATDPLWEDFAAVAAGHGLRACWSTPVLASDGRVLATIANYFREARSPGEDEMAVVDGLASLAAVAIEHANAFRDLGLALGAAEAGSLQLRRLSESAVTLNRSIGAQDLYQQLVDKLRETLGTHQALVSLNIYESHAQEIHAVSTSEKYARWASYQTPSDGTGIHGLVCETNRPLRLTQAELEAHPRWRGFGAQAAQHPPMRGWLAVPLIASTGRNMGVMQLSDKVQGEFTEDDELVAVQFAQMASIAIERAELIDKLRVRNRFFDLSLEMFVIFNPETMRWTQVNPVFAALLGYSAEDLCGREFYEFMHPDDHQETRNRARRLLAGEPVPRMFENRYLHRDGTVHWLEWMSERGEDGLVYGVGRDISHRRRAEQVLRQTLADLASRNRELQDFAFVASHDLQEPLRKIRAFSDRLQLRYAAELSPEASDYLSRSSQAAARMQTLINDLLDYSRVTARGKPFGQVDMAALLSQVTEDLETRLESSLGRIEAGPLPTLVGDPTQLRQMMQNLIANALKFRDPARPPVVRVSAEATRMDGAPAWRFRFADNGIGFDQRYAERVFAPFQRLHGRQDYEGTGIGLAIVRRIVERHHGSIAAEGKPGEGAVFTVCLPAFQPIQDVKITPGLLSN